MQNTFKSQSVYVIFNPELNITKIGISDNPTQRRLALETGCGCNLTLEYESPYLPNAYHYEQKLHSIFADKRKKGEWFNLLPQDVIPTVIDLIKDAPIDSMIKEYIDTQNISAVADKYGMSRQAVIWRLKHYGLYQKHRDVIKRNKKDNILDQDSTLNTVKEKLNNIIKLPTTVFLEDDGINVSQRFRRIEPNINFNGITYQVSKYIFGQMHFAYTNDLAKARTQVQEWDSL
jgi:hypothetical protein